MKMLQNTIGVARSWLARLVRLRYRLATFRDYGNRLNRSVDVEIALWAVASGKREPLTPDECRKLALQLGVPDCYRSKAKPATPTIQEMYKALDELHITLECADPDIHDWYVSDQLAKEARQNAIEILLRYFHSQNAEIRRERSELS